MRMVLRMLVETFGELGRVRAGGEAARGGDPEWQWGDASARLSSSFKKKCM